MKGAPILALDLATVTGFCEGMPDGTPPTLGSIRLGNAETHYQDRWNALFVWLWDRLALPHGEVWIEAPADPAAFSGPRNPETGLMLIGMAAIATQCARLRNVPVHYATVQQVRSSFIGGRGFIYKGRTLVGRGNLRSAEAKHCVSERCRELGWKAPDHNAADAGALFSYATARKDPNRAVMATPLFERSA